MDENVPLVPKSGQKENHDAAAILTDIFQDILEKPTYSKNVATNLSKFHVELEPIKDTARSAKIEIENAALCMNDISDVEKKILKVKARYHFREEVIESSAKLQEFRLLKRIPLYKSIKKRNIMKYGLIEKGDIYPSDMHRIMDFNLNWNIHTCRPCVSDLDLVPVKLPKLPDIVKKTKAKPEKSKPVEIIFRPDKHTITFHNFKTNITYKKYFKVQNISRSTRSFYLDPLLPKNASYKVFLVGESLKVPPGMRATFCVTFKTDVLKNLEDSLKICERSGSEVVVQLKSYRDMPNLYIMMFKAIYPVKCIDPNLDAHRSIVLNNCIDFGTCFKGELMQLYLFMRNCGGEGKFFIIDEETWFDRNLNTIDQDLKLYKGPFTIQPIYWQLEADEVTFLFLTFCAKRVGLNLENAVLLCDNLSYNNLDIIADCILFEEHLIAIKSPEFLPFESLINILYVLHGYMGYVPTQSEYDLVKPSAMFIGSKVEQAAAEQDSNESTVSSQYDVQNYLPKDVPKNETEIIIDYLKHLEENDVQEDWLEGIHLARYILDYDICYPFETKTKKISIESNCPVALTYRWSNVKRTPEVESLKKLKTFHKNCIEIVPTDRNLPAYSSKEIAISLTPDALESGFYRCHLSFYVECVPRLALDDPEKYIYEVSKANKNCVDVLFAEIEIICKIKEYNIVFKPSEINIHRLSYGTEYQKEFELIIYHTGESSVDCYWNCRNPDVVSIDPEVYTANVNERIINNLIIRNKGFENISETLELVVHNHYKKEFKISALVQRSFLRILEDVLDFGWLQIGYTYSKKFSIINDNETSIDWELWEATDDQNRLKHNEITLNVTDLDNGDIEAEYTINAQEATEWNSFLSLYTKHSDETVLDSVCRVTFGIDDLVVYMHTSMCECPILCPKEPIFLNTVTTFTLCIHNVSKIDGIYRFEECYGAKADLVQIKFIPKSGYLPAEKNARVNVEILAHQCCLLDSLYAPCYIYMQHPLMRGEYVVKDPIILTILCVVDDISVNLKIPNVEGKLDSVIWPPPREPETQNVSVGENSSSEKLYSYDCVEEAKDEMFIIDDITKYLEKVERENEPGELETPVPEVDSLRKYFDQDFQMHENVVEFPKVPLREARMQRITVENITPIEGFIRASAFEFPPKIDEDEEVNKVLIKLNVKENDEWERRLNAHGIFVKLVIAHEELEPYETTTIDIWVYASTWGVYAEEIAIDINTLPTFYITVLMEIIGVPIAFPIAKNSKTQHPIYRLGIISHKSDDISRKIYIKNISSIQILASWQVRMKAEEGGNNLIDLLMDEFRRNAESPTPMPLQSNESRLFTNKRLLGQDSSENKIFKIIPDQTLINPGQTVLVTMIFNPTIYLHNLHDTDLEAQLIGTVNLPATYESQPNIYRDTGSDTNLAMMLLTGTLVLPKLNIEIQEEDMRYVLYASEAILRHEITDTRVLFFRNPGLATNIVSISAEAPFKVLEMRTADNVVTEEGTYIKLPPGQCLKVQLNYSIRKELLREICKVFYDGKDLREFSGFANESIDLDKLCYRVRKEIVIMQNFHMKQTIPLEIAIYFPDIEVPTLINFGMVFICNNKKQILTVRNHSACKVEFSVTGTKDFIVNPKSGILPPKKFQEATFFDISVIFIPSMVNVFKDNVVVTVKALNCSFDVTVTGISTNDEKHSCLNTA